MARSQSRLISESLDGAAPAPDQAYAAIGRAVALSEPLSTPFLNRPCVLYSYELSEQETVRVRTSKGTETQSRRTVYMSGLAMTNWAVQTKYQPVRVCGFPVPDSFEETPVNLKQHSTRFREFCEQTEFTRVGKWELGKMLDFAGIIMRESSAAVRKDLWFEGADEVTSDRASLQACKLIEQAILVDTPLCVIGKFDSELGGLVNDLMVGGLQVIPGDAAAATKQLRVRWISYLCFALLMLLIGTLGSYGILILRERDLRAKNPAEDLSQTLLKAFEANDLERMSELITQGVAPESRDSVGRPLLLAAIDKGNQPAIELLLQAKADVNAVQTGWNRSPLEAAFDRADWELFDRLKSLGATGRFVEKSTGQPLADFSDLEASLVQYHQTLNASDAAALSAITDDWPDDYFESVGRGLYKDTVPVQWKIIEGYRDGDLASLVAEGRLSSGGTEQHIITARATLGRWKLIRTYWDQTRKFQFRP